MLHLAVLLLFAVHVCGAADCWPSPGDLLHRIHQLLQHHTQWRRRSKRATQCSSSHEFAVQSDDMHHALPLHVQSFTWLQMQLLEVEG